MSKPSRRPTREARKEHKQKVRKAQCHLREQQAQQGLLAAAPDQRLQLAYVPTRMQAQEQAAREAGVAGQLGCVSYAVTEATQRLE